MTACQYTGSCNCMNCQLMRRYEYGRPYMLECEARTILGWRDRAKQEDFLAMVKIKRGVIGERTLRDALNAEIMKGKT